MDEESQLFAELYGPLRRFAAVVGPIEVDPDDLLQEAVARVLRRRRLTDLDQPGAYLRRTIVNLASVNGISGQAGFVDYSAAKAGIIGFTKALAKEVNPHGINVNAVAPGVIETRVVEQIPKETMEEILKQLKLERLGQPEDVANAVLYLASDEASYVTGHVLRICGGGFIS